MKNFIIWTKVHKKALLISFLVLTVIGVSIYTFRNTIKSVKVLTKTELQEQISIATSLVKVEYMNKNARLLDSLQEEQKIKVGAALDKAKYFEKKATDYKKEGVVLKGKVEYLTELYVDSINEPCRKIVNAYEERVNNLIFENGSLTEGLFELDLAYVADSTGWELCKQKNIVKDSLIKETNKMFENEVFIASQLKKDLKKSNNFFKRNGPWITGVLGIVLGVFVAK